MDVVVRNKQSAQKRKRSLFERFRIHHRNDEKHAKMIADHIRKVKAAEDLDRRSHTRRGQQNHMAMIRTRSDMDPPVDSSSSPLLKQKKQLAVMLKNEFGDETTYMPGYAGLQSAEDDDMMTGGKVRKALCDI